MNIIDAVKSGLPFRRKGWGHWFIPGIVHNFSDEDILATDWVTQEVSVTITKAQLREAFDRMICASGPVFRQELEKELFK